VRAYSPVSSVGSQPAMASALSKSFAPT